MTQPAHFLMYGLTQPNNMKAQILKSMIVNGRKLVAGDIVDVEGWRYIKSLSSNRYIKLIEDNASQETKQAEKPKVTKKTKEVAN